MKKSVYFYLIVLLSFISVPNSFGELYKNDEIIGIVNGENLYLSEFNRLLNAQKRMLSKDALENKETEKKIKEKLIDLMINELLAVQEAKKRNIQISEEEIINKLNLLLQKQGDEGYFIQFLAENNATIEDTKNEIKNQLFYERVKKEIPDFKSFLSEKKSQASIVIYNNKISPTNIAQPIAEEKTELRTKEYPTLTKTKLDEITKLEEKTLDILSKEIEELRRKIEQRRVTLKK